MRAAQPGALPTKPDMQDICKLLTVIATIFVPVIVIASVYGMNFKNMPEPSWRWGIPAGLTAMVIGVRRMLVFF